MIELSKVLKNRGAKRIIACLSHLVLSEAAVKKLEDSSIELIIGTDSVENLHIAHSDKIKVVSVAPLFGEVMSRIHKRESRDVYARMNRSLEVVLNSSAKCITLGTCTR